MLDPTILLSLGADSGNARPKMPVIGSNGTTQVSGNYTITLGVDFHTAGRELFISNDDSANITFVVTCDGGQLGFILGGGEQFDERLPLFTSVSVTSTGLWRWRVRGNVS